MANIKLSDLRAQQQSAPPATDGPPTDGSLPLQASPPVPSVASVAVNPEWETAPGRFPGVQPTVNIGPAPMAGGYLRIFPPVFPSIGAIPQAWKDANWSGPSPWCRVEGAQPHPDFEANLLLVEAE